MKATAAHSRPTFPARKVLKPRAPLAQDHDLPVLAVEENSRPRADWDLLLDSGVQPAMVLGAERRWQGRR